MEPLLAARSAGERLRILAEDSQLTGSGQAMLLCAEAQEKLRTDPGRARMLARTAWFLAHRAGELRGEAESLRLMGHGAYLSGRYRLALSAYSRAIRLLLTLGDEAGVARTQSSALQSLMYLGRTSEAFVWAEGARHYFERSGDLVRLAHVDSNRANLYHRAGQLDEAMMLYRGAHAALRKLGDDANAAIVLRNLAVCAMDRNDHDGALQAYAEARAVYSSKGMAQLLAEVEYNVPYLHYLRGEYSKAIGLYQRLDPSAGGTGNRFYEAVAQLDQSDLYLELNLFREAARLSQKAKETFVQIGTGHESARAETNYAVALRGLGRGLEALEGFRRARRLFLEAGNVPWAAAVNLYRAHTLAEMGESAAARRAAYRAERQLASTALVGKAALAALLLGHLELERGEIDRAKKWCQVAGERAKLGRSRSLQFQCCQLSGQLAERQGNLNLAWTSYEAAHRHLGLLRSSLQHDELKLAFLKDKLRVYEALVDLSLTEGGPMAVEQAFLFAEQAKSRSLADLLSVRADLIPRGESDGFVEGNKVRALRRDLAWSYHQLDRWEGKAANSLSPAQTNPQWFRERISQLEEELAGALTAWRKTDPEYTELQGAADVTVEDLVSCMKPGEALFEYVEARDRLHLFVVRHSGMQVFPLGPMGPVRSACRHLRFQMSRPVSDDDSSRRDHWMEATRSHLKRLYDLLIRPAQALLPEHLIIAPHGELHGLPLHAMDDGTAPLLVRCCVSYALSATVHLRCQQRRPAPAGNVVVFGVPDDRAPLIEREVRRIASLLSHSALFLGAEASLEQLKAQGPGAELLHIATHGLFREDNPLFSSILLGDSRLCLFDLYDLRLNSRLATLSGCFTGLGGVAAGDELVGLARGLLFSGAQGIQVTTGPVHDESTAQYMQEFYTRFVGGQSIVEASRDAMLNMRADRAHPYFWAPYLLMGRVA